MGVDELVGAVGIAPGHLDLDLEGSDARFTCLLGERKQQQ